MLCTVKFRILGVHGTQSGIKPVFLALAGAFFTTESFFTREALNFLLSPELFVILLLPTT